MSKPDDIPQDVWDAAAIGVDYYSRRQEHVARAVLAERERCARVAEIYPVSGKSLDLVDNARREALNIARAIREGR